MELLGIAAHVYMDTFSHYGFSGVGSKYNAINGESIELIGVRKPEMGNYILEKQKSFYKRFVRMSGKAFSRAELSAGAEILSGCLGCAGVSTYPDRPFLHWKCTFEKDCPSNEAHAECNNPLDLPGELRKDVQAPILVRSRVRHRIDAAKV